MARRPGPTLLAMFQICPRLLGSPGSKPASMTQARLMRRSIGTPLEIWIRTSSRPRTTGRHDATAQADSGSDGARGGFPAGQAFAAAAACARRMGGRKRSVHRTESSGRGADYLLSKQAPHFWKNEAGDF